MRKIPKTVGDGAAVLFVTMVAFGLAALLWTWLYPTTEVTVTADGGADVTPGTEDSGFRAFGIFIAFTGMLAVCIAIWAFKTRTRSLWHMLWTACCVAMGTMWAMALGLHFVDSFHSIGDQPHPHPGDVIHVVQYVTPSVALLCAPAIALLVYWLGASFSDADAFEA